MGRQAPGQHTRPLADFSIQGQLWKRWRNELLIEREKERGRVGKFPSLEI